MAAWGHIVERAQDLQRKADDALKRCREKGLTEAQSDRYLRRLGELKDKWEWECKRWASSSSIAAQPAQSLPQCQELDGEVLEDEIRKALREAILSDPTVQTSGKKQAKAAIKVLCEKGIRSKKKGLTGLVNQVIEEPEFKRLRRRVGTH
jgi:hypothetical protein